MLDQETPLIQKLWCIFKYYAADISQCENHQALVPNFETSLAFVKNMFLISSIACFCKSMVLLVLLFLPAVKTGLAFVKIFLGSQLVNLQTVILKSSQIFSWKSVESIGLVIFVSCRLQKIAYKRYKCTPTHFVYI